MAPPIGYLLRDDDIRKIGEYLRTYARRFINTTGLPGDLGIDHQEMPSTGLYIAKTPTAGIPGLTVVATTGEGDIPGRADCRVFILVPNAPNTEAQPVANLEVPVHNFSVDPIDGDVWIQVGRDQYGKWIALNTPAQSERSIGFVAELTSTFDQERGYDWKRMRLIAGGDYEDYTPAQTGRNAFFPDEDETWGPGTRGWLFVNPDGAFGTSTSTSDDYAYIFIPVYRERVYCQDGGLEQQYSLDGGVTWTTDIQLGVDCNGTSTGTNASGTSMGCGWVAGLRPENCLQLTVTDTTGNCIGIDDLQTFILSWNGSGWESGIDTFTTGTGDPGTSDDNFSYIDGSGPVIFRIVNGVPTLTIDGIYLVMDSCGNLGGQNYIDFMGGNDLCNPVGTGDIIACESGTFTVRLVCIECPMLWYCVAVSGTCDGTGTTTEITPLELTLYEATELGDAICSGPYDTEAEALSACGTTLDCCPDIGNINTLYADVRATDGTLLTTITINYDGTNFEGSGAVPCGDTLYLRYTTTCTLQYSCDGLSWALGSARIGCGLTCDVTSVCDPTWQVALPSVGIGCVSCSVTYYVSISNVNNNLCVCDTGPGTGSA